MSKPIVRCRCGHQVLGREILRTEPYEKASGRDSIYLRFRCRRCKMVGEAFLEEHEWDPAILDTPRDERSALERDRFIEQNAISSSDVIAFHRALQKTRTVGELSTGKTERRKSEAKGEKRARSNDKPNEKPGPPQSPPASRGS